MKNVHGHDERCLAICQHHAARQAGKGDVSAAWSRLKAGCRWAVAVAALAILGATASACNGSPGRPDLPEDAGAALRSEFTDTILRQVPAAAYPEPMRGPRPY